MKHYLDADRSTDLGKWYLRALFRTLVNKGFDCAMAQPKDTNPRNQLLELYDEFPAGEAFHDIEIGRDQFVEKEKKESNKKANLDGSTFKAAYRPKGAPPPPGIVTRTQTDGADDSDDDVFVS